MLLEHGSDWCRVRELEKGGLGKRRRPALYRNR